MLGMGTEYQIVKTHTLKVQIHCDGCARKVKKTLKKIEGVYLVSIDTENQKVKVAGNVDCAKLIRKLIESGKHAEIWSAADDQNGNLQGLPSWLLDDTYQDLPQDQINGLQAFRTHPMMENDLDWRRQNYLNQSPRMNSFISGTNNFGAANLGKNEHRGWSQYIAPDELNMEDNLRSLSFPDSRNSAGDYTGYVEKGLTGFQQLLPPTAFEHEFSPFGMGNKMQQYKPYIPSNLPVPPNLQHYNPTLLRRNNMKQNQPSPAHEHQFMPPHRMSNLQQYQYNLPVPLTMNTDILDRHASLHPVTFDNNYMHLPQGMMNPRPSRATERSWNYY